MLKTSVTPVAADCSEPLLRNVFYAAVTFDDGFRSVFENALPEMQRHHLPCTIFIPTAYFGKYAGWVRDENLQKTLGQIIPADEIPQLQCLAIASHTVTHPKLPELSPNEIEAEIFSSKEELDSALNQKTTLLSFPHGAFNATCIEACRKAGYSRVFSIEPSRAFKTPDEFVTGRVLVDPSDWPLEFFLKIQGGYCWLPWAYRLKRKMASRHVPS